MADARKRSAKDIGRESPPSETAKQQQIAGAKGGPQEAQESSRTGGKQPPQTSGRRGARHEQPETVRKGYEAAEDPSRQGDGDPGPRQLKERPSMQGIDRDPQQPE